jgi:hypothetical protein
MGDPAFDERKFAVGVPICRTRVLDDQSAAAAGPDVMRLPDGRLVQCVPAEYVLLALTISNSAAVDSWSMNIATQAEHRVFKYRLRRIVFHSGFVGNIMFRP